MVNLSQQASSRVKSTLKSSQKILKKSSPSGGRKNLCIAPTCTADVGQLCPAMLRWIKMHRHDRNKKINLNKFDSSYISKLSSQKARMTMFSGGTAGVATLCLITMVWTSQSQFQNYWETNILQFCTVSPMTSMTFNQCRKTSTPRSPHRGAWSVSRLSRCLDVSSVSGVCSTMHQNSLHT